MAGASPREPTIHIVTETDNGRTLQAQVGDVIHLRLSENPITGYRWTLLAAAQSVLSLRDDDFQPSVTGGTGSGGERHFCFQVINSGDAQLEIALRREWEPSSAARKRYQLMVMIS